MMSAGGAGLMIYQPTRDQGLAVHGLSDLLDFGENRLLNPCTDAGSFCRRSEIPITL